MMQQSVQAGVGAAASKSDAFEVWSSNVLAAVNLACLELPIAAARLPALHAAVQAPWGCKRAQAGL